MMLINKDTGAILENQGCTERLAGALADAARESDEGGCYAYYDVDERAWEYVAPTDAEHVRKHLGLDVLLVYDDD